MPNKIIQKSRMWKYFIEATVNIIQEEGMDQVTIRKVADRAGYNSSTIYNYFKDLSHLTFFASMTLLKDYTNELASYIKLGDTPLDKYKLAWECFSKYSFSQPEIFHTVFIMDLGAQPEKLLEEYYEIYPSDLINIPESIKPILLQRSVFKRGESMLNIAVNNGLINKNQAEDINEMTNLVWQGMLTTVLNNRTNYDIDEALKMTMKYITKIIVNETEK
ncbi:TetR family transcriptional regulator [Sporosarcina siberiensis]|uniref:TetR family transcriptional regulator n=1 Tax=Sporosarcina siberiensis TaxID=1365606 RepID=A0ABW4SF51_9BACL